MGNHKYSLLQCPATLVPINQRPAWLVNSYFLWLKRQIDVFPHQKWFKLSGVSFFFSFFFPRVTFLTQQFTYLFPICCPTLTIFLPYVQRPMMHTWFEDTFSHLLSFFLQPTCQVRKIQSGSGTSGGVDALRCSPTTALLVCRDTKRRETKLRKKKILSVEKANWAASSRRSSPSCSAKSSSVYWNCLLKHCEEERTRRRKENKVRRRK